MSVKVNLRFEIGQFWMERELNLKLFGNNCRSLFGGLRGVFDRAVSKAIYGEAACSVGGVPGAARGKVPIHTYIHTYTYIYIYIHIYIHTHT